MGPIKLVKQKPKQSPGWRPVTIAADVWDQISALSEETGISKNQIATTILQAGLENVLIEEES